jgi:hypothetical protein
VGITSVFERITSRQCVAAWIVRCGLVMLAWPVVGFGLARVVADRFGVS